jgi:predicted metal-binding membrane protein
MTGMARSIGAPMEMGAAGGWTVLTVLVMFLMWWIMMIAMMTPSATPTLLLFASLKCNASPAAPSLWPAWLFLAGYLVAWAGFSAVAVLLQWVLQKGAVLAPAMMTLKGSLVAGGFLVLAGTYQMTPFKSACLKQCQTPTQFLTKHHRPGFRGAFVMGCHHGLFCLGCCWALMLLLFVGGVMNLWWIAGLGIFVALEKISGSRRWVSMISGAALVGAGVLIAATSL